MDLAKVLSPNVMFVERMRREGREPEWKAIVKRHMADGTHWGKARTLAMKEMGYLGAAEERRLYREYAEKKEKADVKTQIAEERRAIVEDQKTTDFEAALRTLPDKAAFSVEIDWIRAHPAMSRLDRQKDKTKEVIITADDVLRAPHGKAPSRSAVGALQHWANRPGKFFEMILSEQKKKTEDSETAKTDADVDLAEVEKLLAQVLKSQTTE